MAITGTQMIARMRYELKDTDATAPNYQDAELLNYINEGVRELTRTITRVWPDYWFRTSRTQRHTANIVNGTSAYTLPADVYHVVSVSVLNTASAVTLLNEISHERTFDTNAVGWFIRNNQLRLYPTPTASVVNGLVVDFIDEPDPIIAAATVPLTEEFDSFGDFIQTYGILRAKTRQEENPAGFAALMGRIEASLRAMILKTNDSYERGLHVLWREWI